jgi:hypothetical protein
MRLNLSNIEAVQLLESIPHKTCRRAIPTHWLTIGCHSTAQSVLWLFCWAKTGMNSPEAANVSRDIFNRLLPISFADFDARVSHEYARINRYTAGDIERELAEMLVR